MRATSSGSSHDLHAAVRQDLHRRHLLARRPHSGSLHQTIADRLADERVGKSGADALYMLLRQLGKRDAGGLVERGAGGAECLLGRRDLGLMDRLVELAIGCAPFRRIVSAVPRPTIAASIETGSRPARDAVYELLSRVRLFLRRTGMDSSGSSR